MSVRLLTGMIAMAFAFTSASVPAAMVSVRDHGAKGDGKADDRAAIQAAIGAWPGRLCVTGTCRRRIAA